MFSGVLSGMFPERSSRSMVREHWFHSHPRRIFYGDVNAAATDGF